MRANPEWRTVSNLQEIADSIRDQALGVANCTQGQPGISRGRPGVPEHLDCFHRLSPCLAAGLAKALAANDQRVVAVYGYQPAGPAAREQPPPHAPALAIHLLIVVTAPSAALEVFVTSLTRALAASLRALPVFQTFERELIVDANVITEQALRHGLGLAELLSAVPAPSVKLWEREVEVIAK